MALLIRLLKISRTRTGLHSMVGRGRGMLMRQVLSLRRTPIISSASSTSSFKFTDSNSRLVRPTREKCSSELSRLSMRRVRRIRLSRRVRSPRDKVWAFSSSWWA